MTEISELPEEILIKIFEYCKITPLTLVSKQFNEICSNTPSLYRKFNLLITERSNFAEIVKSTRKYQKLLIKFNYKLDRSILDVLRKYSDHIKQLELMRCILNESLFIEIIQALPNLEILSVYTTYLKGIFPIQDEIITTEPLDCVFNLKSLNFRNSDQKFLILLKKASSVKSINISLPLQYPASLITSFLEDHRDVESIDNLMVSEIEQTILLFVLCSMRNLKKLCLEIDKINMDDVRNLSIKNSSIEFLNLYGSPLDPVDFNTVISFFTNLKHLEIEINSILEPINMLHLQRTAAKIESLKIMNCYGDFFNHINLPNLKVFEIYDVSAFTPADWIEFTRRNPKIQVLTIKDEAVTDEIFRIITQEFKNLNYLEMYYDPQRLTNDILNYICDSLFPRNIRTLKIRKRQWQHYSKSFFTLTEDHKSVLEQNPGFNLILK